MVERKIRNKAKKAHTRILLFESAKKLFTERGYEGVKIADITGTAGVSVGTFYEYFENKDDIFLEIAREVNQNLRDRISHYLLKWESEPVSLKERIRQGVITAFDVFDEYPYCVPVIAMGQSSGIPAVNEVYSLIMRDIIQAIAGYLRRGVEMKTVKDMDPDIITAAIMGIFSGIATIYPGDKASREHAIDTLTEFIAGGILNPGAEKSGKKL